MNQPTPTVMSIEQIARGLWGLTTEPRASIPLLLIACILTACVSPRQPQAGLSAIDKAPGPGTTLPLSVDVPDEHATLHGKSRPVDPRDPNLKRLVGLMDTVVRRQQGHGLAAVQIGVPVRLILLRREDPDHAFRFQPMLNPVAVALDSAQTGSWETCLSVPWGYRYTDRAREVTVRYQNLQGLWKTERITSGEAVVLQHELDHLEGVLLNDGLSRAAFIPEQQIGVIAEAARRDCLDRAHRDCRASMKARWRDWAGVAPRSP